MMDAMPTRPQSDAVEAMIAKTGNERFVLDSYRRFIQMFGDVVMNVPHSGFERGLQDVKDERGRVMDTELDSDDLRLVIKRYLALYKRNTKEEFPVDPVDQLFKAINAVFRSWNNERAIKYRQMNDIRGLGTAVNVQTMVFGNMVRPWHRCRLHRDPSTGENMFYGEYLMNAQGEDVVAASGPPSRSATSRPRRRSTTSLLISAILGKHYKDMQDVEFTIQEGKLYMLQTRNGKRTVFSWLRSQVEMVEEGLIDKKTAVSRVPAGEFGKLFAPILDAKYLRDNSITAVTKGLNASPGGACGEVYFTAEKAEQMAKLGKEVILVRGETSPEDIGGMAVSKGIVTSRGGMTSHAAVVARGMGCPCVSGAGELHINEAKGYIEVNGTKISEGDYISLDGFTGEVYASKIPVKASEIVQVLNGSMKESESLLFENYKKFMGYVQEIKRLGVYTNADTPHDVEMAVALGLRNRPRRTEHMFFGTNRIMPMRKMILASNTIDREKALADLLPMQRSDFEESSRRLRDGRRRSACSTRRSMSSFQTTTPVATSSPCRCTSVWRRSPRRPPASTSSTDARLPWMSPGHHLSGDPSDAGQGDHRGRHQRQRAGIEVHLRS